MNDTILRHRCSLSFHIHLKGSSIKKLQPESRQRHSPINAVNPMNFFLKLLRIERMDEQNYIGMFKKIQRFSKIQIYFPFEYLFFHCGNCIILEIDTKKHMRRLCFLISKPAGLCHISSVSCSH